MYAYSHVRGMHDIRMCMQASSQVAYSHVPSSGILACVLMSTRGSEKCSLQGRREDDAFQRGQAVVVQQQVPGGFTNEI